MPGDILNERLRHLEDGDRLSCIERLTIPPGRNMAGVTASIGNLSATIPDCGFSNPGGSGNVGAATSGVSLDQFTQLQSKYEILEE